MQLNIRFFFVLILLNFIFKPLYVNGQVYQEYTLYSPNNSRNTYLIDMNKNMIHQWSHTKSGGYSVYLLEDGSIIRPAMSTNSSLGGGGEAGVVQRVSWSGTLLWEYTYSSSTYRTHHDIEPMPNGNVLLVAWEVKTAAQAAAAGYKQNISLMIDHIIEVKPSGSTGGNIVWQWHAWDHLIQDYSSSKSNYGVVADHPELININTTNSGQFMVTQGDLLHINAVSYNPDLDQIVITSHTLDEIYIIDHSTTTAEAASHSGGKSGKGGDILYRWGMPSNYVASGSQYFSVVHCGVWIPSGVPGAGNIIAFNNGDNQRRSVVTEIVTPIDALGNYIRNNNQAYGPNMPVWTYSAGDFYSDHLGGCQRLPNGNTLIVESLSGYIFEVNSNGSTVWSYSPGGEIVRALRYSPDYAGLTILDTGRNTTDLPEDFELLQNYPNPFNPSTIINYKLPVESHVELKILNVLGKEVMTLVDKIQQAGSYKSTFSAQNIANGVYYYKLIVHSSGGKDFSQVKKMLYLK